MGEWKLGVGVNIDYHFTYDDRHYSVPCELINAKVDVRATATVIEVWRDRQRLTSHERSYEAKGTAVTKPEHRPQSHRAWGEWPPERLVGWARTKGAKTGEVATAILERGPHPESGRRACLGLMRMGEKYGDERLEAACARALAIGNPKLRSVEAILKSGLEKVALAEEVESKSVVHENIRGGDYFDRDEATSGDEGDEIEARYLEEERQSIIHERSTESSVRDPHRHREDDERRDEGGQEVALSMAPMTTARTREPLSVLIGRAQALLSRPRGPRVVRQSGRRMADDRGGDGTQAGEELGASCASRSMCVAIVGGDNGSLHVGAESSGREQECNKVMCEADEGGNDPCEPRQGEMG